MLLYLFVRFHVDAMLWTLDTRAVGEVVGNKSYSELIYMYIISCFKSSLKTF